MVVFGSLIGRFSMATIISDLIIEMQKPAADLILACQARGIEMRPNSAVRSPLDQAKLWRQSRTAVEIEEKLVELHSKGAHFLAMCLEKAGPQFGPPVT